MSTALILFSHGSTLCGAGDALSEHAERLRSRYGFPVVEVGYMNYSEPTFEEAVAKVVTCGANRVVVLPFFLVPGYFVSVALPKRIESIRPGYPGIVFEIAEPLGADDLLADSLIAAAGSPLPRSQWRQGLTTAGRACRARLDCPRYGTDSCPATRLVASGSMM